MLNKKYIAVVLCLLGSLFAVFASEPQREQPADLNVRELILEHVSDAYEWHIATWDGKHISIPLLIIVKGRESGWHVFLSSRFHHGHEAYQGFSLAAEGANKGKIVETLANGETVRPWDFSLTKNAASLLIGSAVLLFLILFCARWYRRREGNPETLSPKGFVAFVEIIVMNIVDDVIKPCIGKNYRRYAPYLLTV
ncbi:MAG: F0F1 ATP synthase subunit A, partial [Prevotellaceae bacterium]|nr:F0F1 ATP synthase subunit A [Prevotellaceae bacterium]